MLITNNGISDRIADRDCCIWPGLWPSVRNGKEYLFIDWASWVGGDRFDPYFLIGVALPNHIYLDTALAVRTTMTTKAHQDTIHDVHQRTLGEW